MPAAKRADGRERMRKREHERERRREEQTQHSLRSAHQDCAKRQRTSNISPESGRTGDGDREIHRGVRACVRARAAGRGWPFGGVAVPETLREGRAVPTDAVTPLIVFVHLLH